MGLFIKVDGQAADQPLIANEQYSAGGMDSVRGYKESEASGDDAVHATVELSFSDPLEKFGIGKSFQGTPYLFYDMAIVEVKEPLLQQDRRVRLEGAGVGLRGSMTKHLEYELAWAMALGTAGRIERNDSRFYFKLKSPF
jgi:hemolysin activation/secretion protein